MVPWSRAEPSSSRRALYAAALIVALGVPAAGHGGGAGSASLRIAVVLDDSGSMRQTDPRRLSVTAAMIAVQLAGTEDRVSLVPLSGAPTPLARGGASGALVRRLQSFSRRSAQTIYDRPLRRALAALRRGGAGKPLVLFLTDGEPDPGPGRDHATALAAQEAFLRGLAGKPPVRAPLPRAPREPGPELAQPLRGAGPPQRRPALLRGAERRRADRRLRQHLRGPARLQGGRAAAPRRGARAGRDRQLRALRQPRDPLARRALRGQLPGPPRGSPPCCTAAAIPARPSRRCTTSSRSCARRRPRCGCACAARSGKPGAYRALLIWDYDLVLRLAAPRAARRRRPAPARTPRPPLGAPAPDRRRGVPARDERVGRRSASATRPADAAAARGTR